MTSEVFKLKGLSKQVKNDYIKDTEERLEARMVKEAEEKALKEAEEKARLEAEEQERKEAEEKVVAEAVAAIEVEAKAKAGAKEEAHIVEEEATKGTEVTLTQDESSNSNLAPLVLKTLEELRKEQQLVRPRLDQQDSVNSNIQILLAQLLQRMHPPPNP